MDILISLISFLILHVQNELVFGLESIVHGTSSAISEFPYAVSLQKISHNVHFCGATIVHRRFVLTTAHCVISIPIEDIRVVAGVSKWKSKLKDRNIRKINKTFVHPSHHKPIPGANDIALVKLDIPYEFNMDIGPATLPSPSFRVPDNQLVHIIGWGSEKTSSNQPSAKLRKIIMKIMKRDECVNLYNKTMMDLEKTVFCTIDEVHKSKGVCKFDSGGSVSEHSLEALIIGNPPTDNILFGVIKGPYQGICGAKNHPDMHLEVAQYRTWIDMTIGRNKRDEICP